MPSRSSTTSDYMAPGIMKDFGKKHGVTVQVTPYNNYDEMLAKIRAPGESFDLVFPGPSVLSKMVVHRADPAAQPLVRAPPEERVAGVPGPLVRPRRAVHRAVHRLRHRSDVPRRPGLRGAGERLRPHVGQAVRRQDVPPRRLRRGHRHVAAPQRHHHRHQHQQPRLRPAGHGLAHRADRPGARSRPTSTPTRRCRRAPPRSTRPGRATRSPASTTCPRARPRRCWPTGVRRTRPAG